MNFFDIVSESACAVKIPARTREQVLREIASRAAALPALKKAGRDEIFRRLLEREQQGSTGFGGGVAIPHARLPMADEFVLFIVTTAKPVEFQAMDRKKVQIFFVLLGPEQNVREHLQILAAISNVLAHGKIRKELLAAGDGSVLHEILLSRIQEQERLTPQEQEKMKLLFLVLYEERFFYDILEYFLQEGVDGATIIDSTGMGQYISNIPLFASFIGFMNEQKNHSRTIMATVPESQAESMVRGIERITGDLEKKQGAMVMLLDVAFCKGTMEML